MKIKTKNLLTLAELTPKEFLGLIDHSIKLKKELNIPILTDIHNAEQCSLVADHVDIRCGSD